MNLQIRIAKDYREHGFLPIAKVFAEGLPKAPANQKESRTMKRLIAFVSASLVFLGVATICSPAVARNFKVTQITLTCTAVTGDSITGQADVTLCDASSSSCSGSAVYVCPTVTCDSSATMSATVACPAPFKVGSFLPTIGVTDYLADGSSATGGFGGGGSFIPLPKKGYTVSITANGGNPSDTVGFSVK